MRRGGRTVQRHVDHSNARGREVRGDFLQSQTVRLDRNAHSKRASAIDKREEIRMRRRLAAGKGYAERVNRFQFPKHEQPFVGRKFIVESQCRTLPHAMNAFEIATVGQLENRGGRSRNATELPVELSRRDSIHVSMIACGGSVSDRQHIIDHYLEPKSEWARSRVARVIEAVAPSPGERVLDLGCANATFSFHTQRLGARPVGIDRDHEVLVSGREITSSFAGISTPRVQADAARLPFRHGAFDAVINADFIEHLPDETKEPIFREMFRVLREGGRGVIYTPNIRRVIWEIRGERLKKMLGIRQSPVPSWREYVDPDHFGLTDPKTTEDRLRAAGFRTRMSFFEFHIPLLSKIPGVNFILRPVFAAAFSNRFLIRITK